MSLARWIVAVLLVVATGAMARAARQPVAAATHAIEVPYTIGAWTGEAEPLDDETLRSVAADAIVNRTYFTDDGAATALYIAYYARQRPGVSIHSPLHCLPGTGWEVLSNQTMHVRFDGGSGPLRRLVAEKENARVMVLYWYVLDGRMVASDLVSRLQLISNRIRLGRNDAALVRLVVPIDDSEAAAEHQGLAFARALVPHL